MTVKVWKDDVAESLLVPVPYDYTERAATKLTQKNFLSRPGKLLLAKPCIVNSSANYLILQQQ